MNVADALDRNTIFFSDNDALVDGGRRWTYREFRRDADRFAHALTDLGVREGDRVGLFMGNSAEFCLAFYGIAQSGRHRRVPVLVLQGAARSSTWSPTVRPGSSSPGGQYLGEIPDRGAIPSVDHLIAWLPTGGPTTTLGAARGSPRRVLSPPAYTDRDDGVEIIYTGGTTGSPKGVVFTHGNVVSNAYAQNAHVTGMSPDDVLVCFLPLYHSFAQNFIFNSCVNCGSTLVILPRFELEPVMRTMTRERVTRWHAVPTIYILVLNAGETGSWSTRPLSRWTGASPPPRPCRARWPVAGRSGSGSRCTRAAA